MKFRSISKVQLEPKEHDSFSSLAVNTSVDSDPKIIGTKNKCPNLQTTDTVTLTSVSAEYSDGYCVNFQMRPFYYIKELLEIASRQLNMHKPEKDQPLASSVGKGC